jgi:thiol-disulfide isomerase/thioredoxin
MMRNMIVALVILTVAAAGYLFRDSFDGIWAMAMTAKDVYAPAPPPASSTSSVGADEAAPLSGFAAKFSNSLMTVGDDGVAHSLDAHKLAGVKYWAFYYSASWCGPCRSFTPDLVSFYRSFKPDHPDFELIFVNLDDNEDAMENYMRADSMPWPAIWHADIDNPELEAKKYCGNGIPCLVLVDADGNVISDTFQDGQYTDPHHVIDDIRTAVQ